MPKRDFAYPLRETCPTRLSSSYADSASRRRHYRKQHPQVLKNVGRPRHISNVAHDRTPVQSVSEIDVPTSDLIVEMINQGTPY